MLIDRVKIARVLADIRLLVCDNPQVATAVIHVPRAGTLLPDRHAVRHLAFDLGIHAAGTDVNMSVRKHQLDLQRLRRTNHRLVESLNRQLKVG